MQPYGSIANDLYSNILHSPSVDLDSRATTTQANDNFQVSESNPGDLWYDEDSPFEDSEKLGSQFQTIGYRDGIIAGKEAALQEGFNVGFKDSVLTGYKWGLVRGISSAMASLADGSKEKLVETEETRNKFQRLHESVQSISSTDALKLFYEEKTRKLQKAKGPDEPRSTETDERTQNSESSNAGVLENYHVQLQSILQECSLVEVRSKIN